MLADLVLVVHFLFIAFVVAGGFAGWICPLTPLENDLRIASGQAGYSGGFIEHYLLPVIYPGALTREIQIWLGLSVLALNAVAYAWLLRRLAGRGKTPRQRRER